jgi:putative phosphoesterase
MTRTLVGVISDTHGLLRPEALAALRGSNYIVHGGDIGSETILLDLGSIAAVTAVRGNTDHDAWCRRIPRTAVLDAAGVRIYVVHDIDQLDIDPPTAGVDVVVFGHSHRPAIEPHGRVIYLNPGSAGPRRFELPVTVARLAIEDGVAAAEILEILPGEQRR